MMSDEELRAKFREWLVEEERRKAVLQARRETRARREKNLAKRQAAKPAPPPEPRRASGPSPGPHCHGLRDLREGCDTSCDNDG